MVIFSAAVTSLPEKSATPNARLAQKNYPLFYIGAPGSLMSYPPSRTVGVAVNKYHECIHFDWKFRETHGE